MRPTTPCPDPIHLQLFVREPACTLGADSLRAHLEHCDDCRKIVAAFEAAYSSPTAMDDGAMGPARWLMPSADATVFFRSSDVLACARAVGSNQNTAADEITDPGEPPPPEDTAEYVPEGN